MVGAQRSHLKLSGPRGSDSSAHCMLPSGKTKRTERSKLDVLSGTMHLTNNINFWPRNDIKELGPNEIK